MFSVNRPPHLSVHWAFVVQFQSDTVVEKGYLTGRVAHVVSGHATAFPLLETLLAFIAQVLRAERRGDVGRHQGNQGTQRRKQYRAACRGRCRHSRSCCRWLSSGHGARPKPPSPRGGA
jgi:hypothetical protein